MRKAGPQRYFHIKLNQAYPPFNADLDWERVKMEWSERWLHCTPKENTFLTCEASDAHRLEHAWSVLVHRSTGFAGAADNSGTNEL